MKKMKSTVKVCFHCCRVLSSLFVAARHYLVCVERISAGLSTGKKLNKLKHTERHSLPGSCKEKSF